MAENLHVNKYPNVYSVKRFSNVLVVPFSDLLAWRETDCKYRGGPIWPNWETETSIRFNGSFYPPADCKPSSQYSGIRMRGEHYFYIGPIYNHFGHQIRDFSSRIIPSIMADPQAVLVFAAHKRFPSLDSDQLPAFFKQILQWFELREIDTLIVSKPTIFDHLCVIPEPEAPLENPCSKSPNEHYIADLTKHAHAVSRQRRLTNVKVYVSRSEFFSQMLGECEIERWFMALGYKIFHPQNYPLKKQLELYLSAQTIVFAEGSAIHALQLLGRNLNRVFVILRRSTDTTFAPIIEARSLQFRLIDAIRGTIRFNANSDRDVAVLDLDALAEKLPDIDPRISEQVHPSRFYRDQKRQLIRTLMKTRPRTIKSTWMLIVSLFIVRPEGYLTVLALALLLLPVDQLLRLINQPRKIKL